MDDFAPFTAIDHVQLAMPAGGEARARRFFAGALGMRELPKPEPLRARGGVWFASGTAHLHLGVDPDFRAAKKAHVALRCRSFAEVCARLAAAGFVPSPPERMDDGTLHAYVDDPFGNRLELLAALSEEEL